MRLEYLAMVLSLVGSTIADSIPRSGPSDASSELAARDEQHWNELIKRKGGGGGGGRGGGGGSSGGSSGSRSGGSSSSSSSGAGAPRTFSGGKFYGGGASKPYKAGNRSPSGIAPVLFVGAAALAFWPGTWAYGAYHYSYANPYRFHNNTADEDESLPVICGCDPYNLCGCDENEDDEYLQGLVGDGDYNELDKNLVSVAEVNGTTTLLINGTLTNGTIAPDEDVANGMASSLEMLGWWPMAAAVAGVVFMV